MRYVGFYPRDSLSREREREREECATSNRRAEEKNIATLLVAKSFKIYMGYHIICQTHFKNFISRYLE